MYSSLSRVLTDLLSEAEMTMQLMVSGAFFMLYLFVAGLTDISKKPKPHSEPKVVAGEISMPDVK
jgi:hypothetical protein